jgi:hypothetical protein
VADRQQLVLSGTDPLRLKARAAGLFLFLPLLARLGFDEVVREAGYVGSRMVPADAALLGLLALKLLDKERRSHIDDFNFEGAAGLFAGLNVLPKKSFAADYSYRAGPDQQRRLLAGWVKRLAPLLMPAASAFSLDFHPIPYRGDEAVLENHYIPGRGTAHASVQSFFAQEHDSRVLCICQRQPDARRTARRGPAVRRVLARPDGPRPGMAVLRLEADDLRGAVAPEPAGRALRHHPPSRGAPGPEAARTTRG